MYVHIKRKRILMERTTVMLPRSLKERASQLARERSLSVGELIRESLREKIMKSESGQTPDPFFTDSEVFEKQTPRDLAAKHDDFLYGQNP